MSNCGKYFALLAHVMMMKMITTMVESDDRLQVNVFMYLHAQFASITIIGVNSTLSINP